jgi:hypothetical protein
MIGVYGPNWPHAKSLLPLRRCLNRRCRQLQYRCSLSSYEIGEQDDGAVRELECIMMLMGLVEFDLTKPGQTIADFPSKYDAVSLDILFKGEFCPGTKANRHPGIVRARKASRGGPWELRRNQRLRYFGGTGCDRM